MNKDKGQKGIISKRKGINVLNLKRIILIFLIFFIFTFQFSSCQLPGVSIDVPGTNDSVNPFMFHVFSAGHNEIMGAGYAYDLKEDLNENMEWTAPCYFWSTIEKSDNEFDWSELDDFVSSYSGKYRVINLGPEWMPGGGGDFYMAGDIPLWIENQYSNPELKKNYQELIEAIVSRYKDDVFMWWIGLEVNLGGDGLSWVEWKEWLKWQVDIIKKIDSETRVAISFGSWEDYHESIPLNAIHEIDAIEELVNQDVEFEVVAIEYHYGTLQEGGIDSLEDALYDLKSTGKEIFLWEIFYPGDTDSEYQDYWSWDYPPVGGYSEEWQAEQLYQTLRLSFEDEQIVGINILHFQDLSYEDINPTDWEAGWRCHAGLVRNDGTPKEAYNVIKNYWISVE